MPYGVQPTGFVIKPREVILRETEAFITTEDNADLIQTPESPQGVFNGIFADAIGEQWELVASLYSSLDPDIAEGVGLASLGSIRNLRQGGLTETNFRRSITNEGITRIDLQDINLAVSGLEGVTYSQVFVNDSGQFSDDGLRDGELAVAIIGGEDEAIASALRQLIVAGVDTFGNHRVTSIVDGFCRSINIIRPIIIEPTLSITVRAFQDAQGCPPPSVTDITASIINGWNDSALNGQDVTHFTLRSLVEKAFPNVELVSFTGVRDGITQTLNQDVDIAFIEIARLLGENVRVTRV